MRRLGLIFLFIQLSAFSASLYAGAGQIDWSLNLGQCGVIHVKPVTTVLIGRDPESWTSSKEQIVVSVIQPSWNYHFFGVGKGGEFVVQGNVYKLSSIHDDAFQQSVVKQHGCTPPGNVTVADAGRAVSKKGSDTVVLSRASKDTVYAGSGSCSARIKLNALSRAVDGSYTANVEWSESSPTLKDPSCNRTPPLLEHQIIKIGDAIQTKGYGRLRVESIWPENTDHSDWVVLTAEPDKGPEASSLIRPKR